jgi:hypothetical protein
MTVPSKSHVWLQLPAGQLLEDSFGRFKVAHLNVAMTEKMAVIKIGN